MTRLGSSMSKRLLAGALAVAVAVSSAPAFGAMGAVLAREPEPVILGAGSTPAEGGNTTPAEGPKTSVTPLTNVVPITMRGSEGSVTLKNGSVSGDYANIGGLRVAAGELSAGNYTLKAENAGIAELQISATSLETSANSAGVSAATPANNTISYSPTESSLNATFTIKSTSGEVTYRIVARHAGTQTFTLEDADGLIIKRFYIIVEGRDVLQPSLYEVDYSAEVTGDISGKTALSSHSSVYKVMAGKTILLTTPSDDKITESDGTPASQKAVTNTDTARQIARFTFTSDDPKVAGVISVGKNAASGNSHEDNAALIRTGDLSKDGVPARITVNACNSLGTVLATGYIDIYVTRNSGGGNISYVSYKEAADSTNIKSTRLLTLDTLVHKTATLQVEAKGKLSYSIDNTNVATVDAAGKVTAVGSGFASLTITAAGTETFDAENLVIALQVSSDATESLWAVDAQGNKYDKLHPIELDVKESTAAEAVKSINLSFVSASGNTSIATKLWADNTMITDAGVSSMVTLTGGKLEAMSLAGICYLALSTTERTVEGKGRVLAAQELIPVMVYAQPADVITQADVSLNLENHTEATLAPVSKYVAAPKYHYALDTGSERYISVTDSGKVYARGAGDGKVVITQEPGTSATGVSYRQTRKVVTVHVASSANTITAANRSVVFATKNAKMNAKSSAGKALTYKVANSKIAAISSAGVITTKKAGTTNVTISSPQADSVVVKLTVTRRPLAAGNIIMKKATLPYTGKVIKPAITVKVGGKALKLGTDYTLAGKYRGINAGTYTFRVVGKGNYRGIPAKKFVIRKADTVFVSKSRITHDSGSAKWYTVVSRGDKNTQVSILVKGGDSASRSKFVANRKGLIGVKRGVKPGKYTVRFLVQSGKNYFGAKKTFTFVVQ